MALALALVNKHYNEIITPLVYNKITLKGRHKLRALSRTIIAGRAILHQYPTILHIPHWPYYWGGTDSDNLMPHIKRILLRLPNLRHLCLPAREPVPRYLLEESCYPFKLHQLEVTPIRDASFIEFLKTQPEIRQITIWDDEFQDRSHWSVDINTTALPPDILPKLRWIHSDKATISLMVPNHPVTRVVLLRADRDLTVHKSISRSLIPLEGLTELIEIYQKPWESDIVSRCIPSLYFCSNSLREYSLRIKHYPLTFKGHSILSLLQARNTPSNGLDILRKSLSVFTALRKFSLSCYSKRRHDLTSEFCKTIPELSRFDVWQESCPSLKEITLFGITLKAV